MKALGIASSRLATNPVKYSASDLNGSDSL